MDNYPAGFNGLEGEEEEKFTFFIHGEPTQEHYKKEWALEELKDKTVRELYEEGILTIE